MKKFINCLSAQGSADKLAFALGWVLVSMAAGSYGSVAMQVAMCVLVCLFVVSVMMRLKATGWSLAEAFGTGVGPAGMVMALAIIGAFFAAAYGGEAVRSVMSAASMVILIIGLAVNAVSSCPEAR